MTRALVIVVCVAAAACQRNEARDLAQRRASVTLAGVAASDPMPARFGYGRPATPDEIKRIDIEIGPDGVGLPGGGGTATSGAPIFAAKCAGCHGPAGEGTAVGMALVGRNPGDAFDFGSRDSLDPGLIVGKLVVGEFVMDQKR